METKGNYDLDKLSALLNENIRKFDRKKRFIHPKTIRNFIYHFKSIKDRKRKDYIYDNLEKYFETLSALEPADINPKVGLGLFDEYLIPILNYYNVYGGFGIHIKWPFLLTISLTLLAVISMLDFGTYYKVALVMVFCFFYLYNHFKAKVFKVYGVYY